jgi:hypothetical protein
MTLANLGYYELIATSGVKTTSPADAKRCMDFSYWTHLVASYDHEPINGGCNSDASTLKGTPKSQGNNIYNNYKGKISKYEYEYIYWNS